MRGDLTLRFDGSFRGGAGGAGAVLYGGGEACWQAARFLSACPSSSHAEFDALCLGVEAAAQFSPSALAIEGDCRVVLSQAAGDAKARKLSKLNSRAATAIEQLPLSARPTFELIGRKRNAHADALSRAAVDAARALHAAAVLASARDGQLQPALACIDRAARERVLLSPRVYDRVMEVCHGSREWQALLRVYRAAQREPEWSRGREHAYSLASDALHALGASNRGADRAIRSQLVQLQRDQEALRRSTCSATRRRATLQLRGDERSAAASEAVASSSQATAEEEAVERGIDAGAWRARLVREVGGVAALKGEEPEAVPRLLSVADRLTTPGGLGWSIGGEVHDDDECLPATFAELLESEL